ncbi:hypothetical protein ES288_A04G013700v1 [Gossypium darwinii]|nr:hypothetical protein ES288_A04G013700v1 [Gossypium darwinii]
MNKAELIFIKIFLALLALNSISLYGYFFSSHPNHHHYHVAVDHRNTTAAEGFPKKILHRKPHLSSPPRPIIRSKPWPTIPSYLPWSFSPAVALNSCEAYFGNGFTKIYNILPVKAALRSGSSWFRCRYSETLRTSICEGGKIRMDPGKIKMSGGGEKLEDVIGRSEGKELPEFEDGAFVVESRLKRRKLVGYKFLHKILPENVTRHPIRESVRSIVIVGQNDFDCQEWVEEPTLLVTRFEYANLYHTVTDWYSAYMSSRVTGLPNRPHLVFVDGHCKTQLEETWKALFSSLRFAKNFTGPVCFRHAIFSPLGYETPFFRGLSEEINCRGVSAHDLQQNPDIHKTARVSEFGEMIRAAFGFPVNRHHADKAASGHNVLFVRREDYLAHPRHEGKVESRLTNEQHVFDSLQSWASDHLKCKVNLINGLLAHMPMKEQIRAIQDASVVIGAHGAGLTHMVSATPNTVILEIIGCEFERPHFQLIAQWKGLEYHAIYLDGSYANPQAVILRLNKIMKSLGC